MKLEMSQKDGEGKEQSQKQDQVQEIVKGDWKQSKCPQNYEKKLHRESKKK